MTPNDVILTPPERQNIENVTFSNKSGCRKAGAMIFFCFAGFSVRGSKKTHYSTVTFNRDLVRQGHMTLNVTFLISVSSDARAMIFFCFACF